MKGKIRNPIKDPSLIASVSLSPPSRLPLNPFIFSHANPLSFSNTDKIHGGPMAGRINFQQADYQCIRDGELWQCNWLEGEC